MKSLFDVLHPEHSAPGAPLVELTAETLCRGIVESPEYRASIERRVVSDTLSSAVECRILDHAIGKPVERVEVKDGVGFESLTVEQLEQRALFLASLARQLRMNDEVHQSPSENDSGSESSIIH